MRRRGIGVILAGALSAAPALASAQPPADAGKAHVGVAIGALVTKGTFGAPLTFPVYGEPALVDSEANWPRDWTVEVDAGLRLWRNLGVALTVSHGQREADSRVSGTIPHPFFFSQPRTLDDDGPTLARRETAVHIGVRWTRRLTRRLTIAAIAGPSVIAVGQDVVTGVVLSETYPYTTVRLSRATTARRDRSAVGGHVAGEGVVSLTPHLGVIGGVRYSRARVRVASADGQTADIDLGGGVVRAGMRWQF